MAASDPSNPDVITQAVIGMLAWSQLLPQWSRGGSPSALRQRASDAITEILTNGLAVDRHFEFRCEVRATDFLPTLENAFDREASSAVKIDLVLATASKLFNRYGIEATSIDAIAKTLGVTKGALYHHMKDKPDLILRCYERSFDLYDKFGRHRAPLR